MKRKTLLVAVVACSRSRPVSLMAGDIVDRPEELTFPDLSFDVPDGDAMRFELANGTPVYIKEDHQLPLVDISIHFRGGRYLVPREKAGLIELISGAWRAGGAGDRTAQEFDETLDFLAANLRANIGDVIGHGVPQRHEQRPRRGDGPDDGPPDPTALPGGPFRQGQRRPRADE